MVAPIYCVLSHPSDHLFSFFFLFLSSSSFLPKPLSSLHTHIHLPLTQPILQTISFPLSHHENLFLRCKLFFVSALQFLSNTIIASSIFKKRRQLKPTQKNKTNPNTHTHSYKQKKRQTQRESVCFCQNKTLLFRKLFLGFVIYGFLLLKVNFLLEKKNVRNESQ